jgi:hypothetical protein
MGLPLDRNFRVCCEGCQQKKLQLDHTWRRGTTAPLQTLAPSRCCCCCFQLAPLLLRQRLLIAGRRRAPSSQRQKGRRAVGAAGARNGELVRPRGARVAVDDQVVRDARLCLWLWLSVCFL